MAAIPNAGPFVEFSIEEDVNAGERLYSPAVKVVAGQVKLPDGPGWGVTINLAWLEKATCQKTERPSK
jgi:L-alanine-DL-glutamate epimerase-like enolase superfamily enzyme